MNQKTLPWLALPVGRLFEIMVFLASLPTEPGMTEREARLALSDLTGRKEKTTENYVRSLRYLGLIEVSGGKIAVSPIGRQLADSGETNWKRVLHDHLDNFSQISDIISVMTDLSMEGYPLTSNRRYFQLVVDRLTEDHGYGTVSIRRVDNYISLFRAINSMQLIGDFPVPPRVNTPEEVLILVRRAFEELKANNPLFERVPWLPIMQLESFLLSRTNISAQRLWECLVELRRRKQIELVQTKPALAAKSGLKVYMAHGIAYSSIGLRGER